MGVRRPTLAAMSDITIFHNNRCKEAAYQELGLDQPAVSDAQILLAVAQHPQLLNRPIVVTPKGAALCRPPEKVLALL